MAKALIPGIPKLERMSGVTGNADREARRDHSAAEHGGTPCRAPATRQLLLTKGECRDLTAHPGPVSSSVDDSMA